MSAWVISRKGQTQMYLSKPPYFWLTNEEASLSMGWSPPQKFDSHCLRDLADALHDYTFLKLTLRTAEYQLKKDSTRDLEFFCFYLPIVKF